jgi:hypothetical protein
MMVQIKNEIGIWLGSLVRGLSVVGITFFSLAIQSGLCWANLETGLIAGGLYMFAELIKFYKITLPTKDKRKSYHFLLFP